MDIEEYLTKIDKKLDKVLNMQTKIAKALHLVPVSKKEERALQIAQNTNAKVALEVADELAAMSAVENPELHSALSFDDLYTIDADIYSGVIGDDILGGK
mgnify:CR=1 FL=1